MIIDEFNYHTQKRQMDRGIRIFTDKGIVLKAVRNDCYHFNINNHAVKIIMDGDDIVYAHCDCDHDDEGYCPHEVAGFLYILKQNKGTFNITDYEKIDYFLDDYNADRLQTLLDDYEQVMSDKEFDVMAFLKNKSKDELLAFMNLFAEINPAFGVFVYQLYLDQEDDDEDEDEDDEPQSY